jgi:hypothetical protein
MKDHTKEDMNEFNKFIENIKPLKEHYYTETDLGAAFQTFRYIDDLELYVKFLESKAENSPIAEGIPLSVFPKDNEIHLAGDEWGFGGLDFISGAEWVIEKIKEENTVNDET